METATFLNGFRPITLEAIGGAALQERIETKFLLPEHLLPQLTHCLTEQYRCLEIDSLRCFHYTTYYFDTPDFRLYLDHHNGYTKRLKVRCRRYDDTGDCYLETKQKYNLYRTQKTRSPINGLRHHLTAEDNALIHHPHLIPQELEHQLTNTFQRSTLCNEALTERVTIDRNICLYNSNDRIEFNQLALVEVKQEQRNNSSPAIRALKQCGAVAAPFSKYALGTALLHPELKRNLLKPILSLLKKHHYA